MIHLYDRVTIERAHTLNMALPLRRLLDQRIAALDTPFGDLTDWTEFLIVEPGDTEEDVIRHLGFSPLVDPDSRRFPDPAFQPYWDWLALRDGWFELIVTFGSTFAYVLLLSEADGAPADLRAMCRRYAAP